MDNFDLNINDLDNNPETVDQTTNDVTSDQQTTESDNAQSQSEMFKYTAAGKEIEEDRDTVLKRASMGYHYAQNMQELKAQRNAFEQERQQKEQALRELEGKWSQYDQYARDNPQWADFVKQQWENRTSFNGQPSGDTQGQTTNLPPELQSEISELRQFKDEFKGFMSAQKQEREDAELNSQIDSTRKEYPDVDFSYSDPSTGQTLEFQVLQHMQTHGLNNFRAGFRDFYHDQLIQRAATKAKEDTAKTLQQRQQKGYIGETDTPTQGLKQTSTHNKSYFDLIDEGIAELGLN